MREQKLKIDAFKKHAKRFEKKQISKLYVAIDDKVVGLIGYTDGTRPEVKKVVRKLRANGKRRVILLSGDNVRVARHLARKIGIDEAIGGLMPRQKSDYVRKLRAQGHVVAMVGDGINDAPALAVADVGISIAGSTEVAVETADVILLEGGLANLAKAFAISDQAMRSVRQSLTTIIVPNAIAMVMAAFGILSPPIVAVINNGATIGAVLVGICSNKLLSPTS